MPGQFITFEGIEGCGKTTQIRMLAERLKANGRDVVLTREPGGTEIGERIRSVLLDSAHDEMAPITELLLYAASRTQHIAEVIAPAIRAGKLVLCDRYSDATSAYQGAARRIPAELIKAVHAIATGGLMPDLTLLLDCPAGVGLARARERNERIVHSSRMDRFERETAEFHELVRQGYLAAAAAEPRRFVVVDAAGSIEDAHGKILSAVEAFLRTAK
jgi:dTMP kinase